MTISEAAPPISGWNLRTPDVQPGFRFGPHGRAESLTERHRPRRLADIVGQSYAIQTLSDFAAFPHSAAWLFAGPTGTGKSCTAMALANELGVHPTSGLWAIDSGMQDTDTLLDLQREFRYAPMGGGWRLILVEECDWMSRAPKVEQLWLSILDRLPTRTVFVFTTNHPSKLTSRFLDRTQRLDFTASLTLNQVDAQELIDRIWRTETGQSNSPRAYDLTDIAEDGNLSYRRVVRAVEVALRDRPAPAGPIECRHCERMVRPELAISGFCSKSCMRQAQAR